MNNSDEVIKVLREIADGLEAGKDVGITMAYVIPGEDPAALPSSLGGHTIVSTYGQLATVLGMMELEKTYVQQRWLQSQLEAEGAVAMVGKLEELRVKLDQQAARFERDDNAPITMIQAEVTSETFDSPEAAAAATGGPPASRLSPSASPEVEAAPAG